MTDARLNLRSIGLLALGLAALLEAGCLVAAIGVAGAGAAAAGYTYHNGLLYRDYGANVADTLVAVRGAMGELQFPLLEEKTDTGSAYLRTQTADGHTVRIYLDIVSSPVPAEGALTRVGIRVGFIGDDAVSARILDQVSRHIGSHPMLAAPPVVSLEPPIQPTALPARPVPVVATKEPPLAR